MYLYMEDLLELYDFSASVRQSLDAIKLLNLIEKAAKF